MRRGWRLLFKRYKLKQEYPILVKETHVFDETLDQWLKDYWCATGSDKERLRERITQRVIPYVRKIAHGLARRSSDPVEDLIQVGSIGLIKAIEKYDPLAGSSFKTYATYLITGEIRHYLRDKSSMIKAPRQIYELYYRINSIVQRLSEDLGRTPTDIEIAEALQCPVNQVNQAQDAERRRQPMSLDQFINPDSASETQFVERLVDEKYFEVVETRENRMLLERALANLKEELKAVVTMTYFEDLSQAEIATRLGISQMQVSRRLRKALDLLHAQLDEAQVPR
jgi:RNA polymerase sigma-B factor